MTFATCEAFGLDETSYKRGHKYITLFIDLDRDTRPVVFATIGKGKKTVERFKAHPKKKGGVPDRVLEVVSDMSGSFVGAVSEHFPNAEVTVDWFHVVQLFTKAVDEVRSGLKNLDHFSLTMGWSTSSKFEMPYILHRIERLGPTTIRVMEKKIIDC